MNSALVRTHKGGVFPLLELTLLLRGRDRIQQTLCFCLKGFHIRQELGKQRNGFFCFSPAFRMLILFRGDSGCSGLASIAVNFLYH